MLQYVSLYIFEKNKETNQLYWDDNFVIEADNASLFGNKQEMWETMTAQFMSGSIGNPADPNVLKLYWSIMKQLQFPFAAAINQNITEREQDLDPAVKAFLFNHPDILDRVAQMMAAEQSGQGQTPNAPSQTSQITAGKAKTGQNANEKPEPANPVPPAARTELEANNAQSEE